MNYLKPIKFFCLGLLLLFCSNLSLRANVIDDYFNECRKTGSSNYAAGMQIVKNFNTSELTKALEQYYGDTITFVWQQAHYFANIRLYQL